VNDKGTGSLRVGLSLEQLTAAIKNTVVTTKNVANDFNVIDLIAVIPLFAGFAGLSSQRRPQAAQV
jgi:hypothetical protein